MMCIMIKPHVKADLYCLYNIDCAATDMLPSIMDPKNHVRYKNLIDKNERIGHFSFKRVKCQRALAFL